MALDLSLRAEANDLKCTAGILEALADLEEDPQVKKDILETSQDLIQTGRRQPGDQQPAGSIWL